MIFKKLVEILTQDSASSFDPELFVFIKKAFGDLASEESIDDVLEWAKERGYIEKLEMDDKSAEVLLQNFLDEENFSKSLIENNKIRDEVLNIVSQKTSLTANELKQSAHLVLAGDLFRDLGYTVSVLASLVIQPDRFLEPENRIKENLHGLVNLPGAIAADLDPRDFVERVQVQVDRILSGKPIDDPHVLNNTFAGIYSLPEIGEIIEVASALLDEENESLRLALLIYLRLNGISLNENDLDKIKETLLDREKPKLGELLLYFGQKKSSSLM